jgi:eukaryotic-like serine/threonine-protein kinase
MDGRQLQQANSWADGQSQLNQLLPELPAQYEILDQITSGAMGKVFRAQNRYTGAQVAIKIMRAESTQNTTAIQRFFLEAKAASLLKHPHICRVLDFGVSTGGTPYLVMEWVEGINLEKKILGGGKLSMWESLSAFRQIASAIGHAHQKKIIHRDLKPENIMVNFNTSGQIEIQLIDFGIVKMLDDSDPSMQANTMTRLGMAVGTPAYMSPEQAKGAAVDGRTDIYSLGCVMYFVLTGKPPFTGRTIKQVMEKHLYEVPDNFAKDLNVPDGLKSIIFRAMSKSVDQRYASMEALIADLDKLMRPAAVAEKQTTKAGSGVNKFIWILWFVIGYAVVFGIRFAWEFVLDASSSNTPQKPTQRIIMQPPVNANNPQSKK